MTAKLAMKRTFMGPEPSGVPRRRLEDFRHVSSRAVAYREFAAPAELADLVVCTWQRTVPGSHSSASQRVVPDGCVDLVWRGGRLQVAGPPPPPLHRSPAPGAANPGP